MLKYTAFKFDLKVEIFTRSEKYRWEFLIALFVLRILSWSTPIAKTLLAAFTSKFELKLVSLILPWLLWTMIVIHDQPLSLWSSVPIAHLGSLLCSIRRT